MYNKFNLESIYEYQTFAPSNFPQDLADSIQPFFHLDRKYYLLRINFEKELAINFLC